jgi:RIO kinase 2
MKLDPKNIRHLATEDWRVLQAVCSNHPTFSFLKDHRKRIVVDLQYPQVEQGSRNHEIVPTSLIISLTNLRGGTQIQKSISTLAKNNLISRIQHQSYDGYRLTYGGLDYLALHAQLKSDTIYSVGNQIGVGKESDIHVVASSGGRRLVLKIHRLGRISFRTVKANRDYLRKGSSGSWMYMSRLAAMKEYHFMCALRDAGFPVPEPVGWNRHTVVMELIDAFPLRQISKVPDPPSLYAQLISLILRFAKFGLIHGDFNEFNILVEELGKSGKTIAQEDEDESEGAPRTEDKDIVLNPIVIDFPQTLSISHPNAEFYFDRDVNCIKTFFQRRFHFTSDEPGPFFADAIVDAGKGEGVRRLDLEVEATGFNKKLAKELEKYMKEVGVDGDANGEDREHEFEALKDVEEEDSENAPAPAGDDVEVSTDSVTDTDLAVKSSDDSGLADGMVVLQLSAQNLDALQHSSTALADQEKPMDMTSQAGKTFSRAGTFARGGKGQSHAGTASSRRTVNPAKVATGWAI